MAPIVQRAPPPPDLAPFVVEFSARRADGPRAAFPVFPAARAELLFHFGDPFEAGATLGALRPLAPATLLGPRALTYWQAAGPRIDWFLIQLTPLGCRRFLGLPFAELWEGAWPLTDRRLASELHQRLASARTLADRIAAATAVLRSVAAQSAGDPLMSDLVALGRTARVREIGSMTAVAGIGPRRLRQRFAAEIGIGPKRFLSLMRFGRLLAETHPEPWRRGPALDPEYADDSHAIREFRRLAGTTPGAYRAAKSAGDALVFTGPSVTLDASSRPYHSSSRIS